MLYTRTDTKKECNIPSTGIPSAPSAASIEKTGDTATLHEKKQQRKFELANILDAATLLLTAERRKGEALDTAL